MDERAKILIVEDNPRDMEFLQTTLASVPYSVISAATGEKALSCVEDESPDLVILDILLPDIDGFEVCQRIRKMSKGAGLPVLFYTAVTTVNEKLIGLESGASDFLTKSSDARELLVRIKNLLHTHQAINVMMDKAFIDDVSQVFNRKYLLQRLEEECARSIRYQRNFSCALFDLDHFRRINETFGKHTGDRVLKKFGDFLRQNTRGGDLVCRRSDDEFALLLPEVNLQGAYHAAERIRKLVIETNIFQSECSMPLTISSGVSALSPTLKDNKELLLQAQGALTDAKNKGCNTTRAFDREW
ncbi:MAG: diguanylate cyclase [Candidatus Omnitrophica bacterium]|nr:diguanylate cyclase [Candidatus Omnitrophota bacterium]